MRDTGVFKINVRIFAEIIHIYQQKPKYKNLYKKDIFAKIHI